MNRLRKSFAAAAAAASLMLASGPVLAALAEGAKAPMFTAKGARAGKPVTVDLAKALKRGPVVLYFFPAAFTGGCNIEAHAFAQAMPEFRAAGATVIGMTAGNVDQLAKFSAEKCAGQFAVAAASPGLIERYDVALEKADGTRTDWSDRTTYVIAPNGTIADAYTEMNPAGHITRSLAAVRKLARK